MSTNCPHCGYKDNEVKSGGAIAPQGKKITLKVENEEDIARDILKVCRHDLLSRTLHSDMMIIERNLRLCDPRNRSRSSCGHTRRTIHDARGYPASNIRRAE